MIKIGLMGCGTVADYGHLPAIVQTEGVKLEALFDPNAERLALVGKKFGVDASKLFTDAERFMTSGIDAVSVTSPAPFHFENVMLAAKHHKHVLCEKPLAESEADGRKMSEAMKGANCILVLGFIYRFGNMGTKVRELVQSGAIGEPRSLRLVYIWDDHGKFIRDASIGVVQPAKEIRPGDPAPINLRRDRFMREGGPMVDCGVHQIDLARWWLNSDIESFTSHGAFIDDDYDIPDHIYIHMQHASGAHSMIESSFSYGHTCKEPQVHYRFEAIGTQGIVRFDRDTRSFDLVQPNGTTKFKFQQEKNFHDMYAQFRKAIETGDIGTFATAEDGIIATRIARAATEAIKRPSRR